MNGPTMPTALEGFVRVTDADLSPMEMRQVRLPNGTAVCVGNVQGTLFAVADECPHAAFPLSDSYLGADGTLECGCHGARFDVIGDRVLRGPATEPPARYELQVAEGGVWIRNAP